MYVVYLHDGFYSLGEVFVQKCMDDDMFLREIKRLISSYNVDYRVILVAFDPTIKVSSKLCSYLWAHMDALPMCIDTPNGHASLEEQACAVVRKALTFMAPAATIPTITGVSVGYRHKVEVDGDNAICLSTLEEYKRFTKPEHWEEIALLAEKLKGHKFCFVNSTPRGGGVALMRHALVRFFKKLNLQIDWYVMKPDPRVFEITKHKFHNVLQGAQKEPLTDDDKSLYEYWCERNAKTYWLENSSPFKQMRAIVIDDPQPAAMIPMIKDNTKSKIVYRNHIQIDKDLVDDKDTVARQTLSYLHDNFISKCDILVSHPLPLPKLLDEFPNRVEMPATTDPIDGLNKPLTPDDMLYYASHFDRICEESGQPAPPRNVPWIVQIARFDPSKGIEDVIRAFTRMKHRNCHLVLTGHGSIDDPEGTKIYNHTRAVVSRLPEAHSKRITVVRVPPSDQMLNFVLQNSRVCLQLSHKEGFEIKVTEAIMKGKPVVAYSVGGIPRQIQHQTNGYLVKVGDTAQVAKYLDDLLLNHELYEELSTNAKETDTRDYLTPANALRWLRLFDELTMD